MDAPVIVAACDSVISVPSTIVAIVVFAGLPTPVTIMPALSKDVSVKPDTSIDDAKVAACVLLYKA